MGTTGGRWHPEFLALLKVPRDDSSPGYRRAVLVATLVVALAIVVVIIVALGLGSRSELDGTSWRLTAPAGVTATARFEDGTIAGDGPVNLYSGSYEARRDGSFGVGVLTRTERGAAPELMQAEERFFQSLGEAARYQLEGDVLALSAEDGSELLGFERTE